MASLRDDEDPRVLLGLDIDDEPAQRAAGRRAAPAAAAAAPPRRRLSVIGVIGEVLMTLGVVMMLFVGWKYWLNDRIAGSEQNQAGASLAQQLGEKQGEAGAPEPSYDPQLGIPVGAAPTETREEFAVLYVPAWGADYSRPIAHGTGYHEVLNTHVGHYEDSPMPGAVGNFAIAGHRLAYGASMQHIHELRVGDEIIVQTKEGYYTYVYRSGEYVQPSQVDVLNSVPRVPEGLGSDRILTLTSCNPFWSTEERIIAYAVFDSFRPAADGPPPALAGAAG
ncbi:MAG: class E sortase [Pseudoclavibacter sp.]|nr:class E sortase [Pseudoclavibacter sp.]